MRILIEEYRYSPESLGDVLYGLDALEDLSHRVAVCYVGYFYNVRIRDCVFILPKVLMDENGLLFGHVRPEEAIDFEHCDALTPEERRFLYTFAVWIYRAIVVYKEKNPGNNVVRYKAHTGTRSSKKKSHTLIDIVLSIIRFATENAGFVLLKTKAMRSGRNKINWSKTVSHCQAVFQDGAPVYLAPIGRRRVVDDEDDLLVIFYSILAHIGREYGFPVPQALGVEIVRGKQFAPYLNGLGRKRLRQIKYRYFSDKTLRMWELCDAFFDEQHELHITEGCQEYLLAKDFNIAFEAIVDELIGDKDLPVGLKNQEDGKIVDHLFRYRDILQSPETQISNSADGTIYIGDSKYYMIGHSVGKHSVAKQFTYARNVIQWKIDIFNNNGKDCPAWLCRDTIRDPLTEGYPIVPNFFISAKIFKESKDGCMVNKIGPDGYADDSIEKSQSTEDQPIKLFHFPDRLFDRDTLFVFHYDVSFLHLIWLYARSRPGEIEKWKNVVREKFRTDIQVMLNREYHFHALLPRNIDDDYLVTHFKELNGKLLGGAFSQSTEALALAIGNGDADGARLLSDLGNHYFVQDIQLGDNPIPSLTCQRATAATVGTSHQRVLVGYCKSGYYEKITTHFLYYIRPDHFTTLLKNGLAECKYLFLYRSPGERANEHNLFKITGIGITSRSSLISMGFAPTEDAYGSVSLKPISDITKLPFSPSSLSANKFGIGCPSVVTPD